MTPEELTLEVLGYNYPNTDNSNTLEYLFFVLKSEQKKMKIEVDKKRTQKRKMLELFWK